MTVITSHGIEGLADAMTVMVSAFDPQFGEAWTAAQCTGVLAMPGAHLLIARNAAPVGFALLRTVIDEAELMLLAVAPEARGQGIGRALLQHSIDTATTSNATSYFLEVRSDNPAIDFYERFGLRQVGVRRDYYRAGNGVRRDALTYRLSLR
ncbi:ribosomal protein S18-alanine N-acetyltransferase [Sphingomonas sp. SUN039]|uniref:ribosomal protein S18-alanine N-acetyltransferase n=1 Tax=Sphingomonas sp. SUN039 TaxID=2937787 RepID=UPI002164C130|nr:ribosomal protein S18-alanine N-acetyltransferase [Sphingomonas sp. SUN039]UVO54768.1 ribosomal protein S18-alanine N-acetyltransferase [Sphingomonas sp. SUN039]